MSRPIVSLIEQVLNGIRTPLRVSDIHIHCEHIAGHPISRNTVKRELARITNEEAYKFQWIKKVAKGTYQYVPSDKPSIEDFHPERVFMNFVEIDEETVSIKIKIPSKFTKVQFITEQI